ncbi:MAG: hypothetical protein ACLPKE_21785, partial [Streptosporangiaceae bacterium]
GYGGPQQNEQQVDGAPGGQTGAFSEQAGYGAQQNEQQVDGGVHGGQTGAFSEQARGFGGGSYGEPPRTPVFHGTVSQPESGTHDDMSTGMHGGEPVNFAAGGGPETGYGTPVSDEPTHVSGEVPSYDDAGHEGAVQDAGGDTGHYGGADAGPEMHHG